MSTEIITPKCFLKNVAQHGLHKNDRIHQLLTGVTVNVTHSQLKAMSAKYRSKFAALSSVMAKAAN
jgi:hypothetical protein